MINNYYESVWQIRANLEQILVVGFRGQISTATAEPLLVNIISGCGILFSFLIKKSSLFVFE